MNIWSRLLLHLRRARLRHRFMKEQLALQDSFRRTLQEESHPLRQWHDVEWITEPILHVLPDMTALPVALVGIVAVMTTKSDSPEATAATQSQAGTAVFYFENNAWQSNGKVLLNLTPAEAFHQLCHKVMRD